MRHTVKECASVSTIFIENHAMTVRLSLLVDFTSVESVLFDLFALDKISTLVDPLVKSFKTLDTSHSLKGSLLSLV